jgi:LacI family transcriptional regulator
MEYFGTFNQESGFEMTYKVMAKASKPTAIFATNNFIAIGVLKALQELGLHVPEDVAVVGFDDLPSALVTFPFLTVAVQPAYQIGKRATEILLSKMAGQDSDIHQEVVLPAEIVIRQSSGRSRELIH